MRYLSTAPHPSSDGQDRLLYMGRVTLRPTVLIKNSTLPVHLTCLLRIRPWSASMKRRLLPMAGCMAKADTSTKDPALPPSLGVPRRANCALFHEHLHQRGGFTFIRDKLTLILYFSAFGLRAAFRSPVAISGNGYRPLNTEGASPSSYWVSRSQNHWPSRPSHPFRAECLYFLPCTAAAATAPTTHETGPGVGIQLQLRDARRARPQLGVDRPVDVWIRVYERPRLFHIVPVHRRSSVTRARRLPHKRP
ncbi:hypothetical protein H4582DRAFT_1975144 [Lactarius indigo]|nr:hypothetical protein H4582DRAFT_1975144 [Lactarius indigo]